jgi:hypothetical protein
VGNHQATLALVRTIATCENFPRLRHFAEEGASWKQAGSFDASGQSGPDRERYHNDSTYTKRHILPSLASLWDWLEDPTGATPTLFDIFGPRLCPVFERLE